MHNDSDCGAAKPTLEPRSVHVTNTVDRVAAGGRLLHLLNVGLRSQKRSTSEPSGRLLRKYHAGIRQVYHL